MIDKKSTNSIKRSVFIIGTFKVAIRVSFNNRPDDYDLGLSRYKYNHHKTGIVTSTLMLTHFTNLEITIDKDVRFVFDMIGMEVLIAVINKMYNDAAEHFKIVDNILMVRNNLNKSMSTYAGFQEKMVIEYTVYENSKGVKIYSSTNNRVYALLKIHQLKIISNILTKLDIENIGINMINNILIRN